VRRRTRRPSLLVERERRWRVKKGEGGRRRKGSLIKGQHVVNLYCVKNVGGVAKTEKKGDKLYDCQ
jgi:hypothetical protein